MCSATTSLPTPVSPRMRTVVGVEATRRARSKSLAIAASATTMPAGPSRLVSVRVSAVLPERLEREPVLGVTHDRRRGPRRPGADAFEDLTDRPGVGVAQDACILPGRLGLDQTHLAEERRDRREVVSAGIGRKREPEEGG